jgi:hypothetical protein
MNQVKGADEMTIEPNEQAWLAAFLQDNLVDICRRAMGPYFVTAQCFGIAQWSTLKSEGRLLYHEGHAYDKITHARLRHAWNTFHGEIVDLSLNLNIADIADISLVPASDAYEEYKSERAYTWEEVRKVLTQRSNTLDWFQNPEYSAFSGHGPADL